MKRPHAARTDRLITNLALQNPEFLPVLSQMLRIVAAEKEQELVREMKSLKSMRSMNIPIVVENIGNEGCYNLLRFYSQKIEKTFDFSSKFDKRNAD